MSDTDHRHEGTTGLRPLPREVTEFVDGERGHTLLVTGAPGTGKTLFTIRLLDRLGRRHEEPLYVTARSDEEMIVETYLEGLVGIQEPNVLDLSSGSGSLPWDVEEGFDARTVDSLFEWIRSIGTVSTRPVIAFDSWELICQHFSDGRTDWVGQDALTDRIAALARSGTVDLVLVAESERVRGLEYAVDGVVSLRARSDDRGRTYRELVFEKLRGVRIGNRRRPFTLANGRFDTFAPVSSYPIRARPENVVREPLDGSKSKFTTGIGDLDGILDGGYNRGSTVHLELGQNLSRDTWSLPVLPTVTNFLSAGMGVVVLPPSESSPGLLHQHLDRLLPEGRFDSLCEVFVTYSSTVDGAPQAATDPDDGRSGEPMTTVLQPGGIEYANYASTVERIRERSEGPILQVLSMDATAEGIPEFGDRLGECANDIALHNDLGILITKSTGDLQPHANRIADVHFHVEKCGEALVAYGENPLTPILGVGIDRDGPVPEVVLTEMV